MKNKKLRPIFSCLLLLTVILLLSACNFGVRFEVSFIVDGEQYAKVSTNGSKIAMPKDPQKEGYTFDAWYWDEGTWSKPFTAASIVEQPLTGDMKVYARFKSVTPSVTTEPAAPVTTVPVETTELSVPNRTEYYDGGAKHLLVENLPSHLTCQILMLDENGAIMATAPVNAGTYYGTVTFALRSGCTGTVPAPITATLTILPMDVEKAYSFAMQNKTVLYQEGTGYTLDLTGSIPVGIAVSYSMTKIENADGTACSVAVPSCRAYEAGVYRVTATFQDRTGNYQAVAPKSALLTIYSASQPKAVLKYTPVLDGVLDDAYLESATYQTTLDTASDPTENCILSNWYKKPTAAEFGAEATVYMLWDDQYVYIAIEVRDTTDFYRGDDYSSYPNPWICDGVELYYHLGGTEQPVIPFGADTYPTYKAVAVTSKGGIKTAIEAQKSVFWSLLDVASTSEPYGDGGVKYTVEYRLVAATEEGASVTAGEYAYLAIQINDLTGAPEVPGTVPNEPKYPNPSNMNTMTSAWAALEAQYEPYMAIYSNRHAATPERFLCFEFTDQEVN